MLKDAVMPRFTGPEELRTELFQLLANDSRAVGLVLQHCFDGVFYWDLKDFSRQFVGPRFWEMLGIDAESEDAKDWHNRVHAEDRQNFYLAIEEAIQKPDVGIDQIVRYRMANGEWLHIRTRGIVILDDGGLPLRLLVLNSDVSDHVSLEASERASRQQLEQALRDKQISEEELQFIFDAIPLQVFYKDDQNIILRANKLAAENLGMNAEDLKGADTYDLFPDMAAKYHEDDLKVIDSGVPELGIVEAYAPKDRPTGWVKTDKIPMRFADGSRTLLVVAADITELKEQSARLEKLSEASSQFASIAAHDLRSPLRQTRALMDMLLGEVREAGVELSEDGAFALDHITVSLNKMEKMVSDLHMLSKLESRSVERLPVDINVVMERVQRAHEGLLAQANANITIASIPQVTGSERLVEYVLSNLVRNACNFRRGDNVNISLHAELDVPNQRQKIYFSDDGIGVPEGQRKRIFEPFARLEAGKTGEGTGLGLAIVSRIMTAHGGDVSIDSSYKSGTRFILRFPVTGVLGHGS
ncbi:sensor histidine kinase [Henriciella marina]|uniref:sensor histidine kinase n=1 Tax=Henriciella marina TaxID=453851 RepID=UPI000377D1B8|nr:ATP-binding protein [Henriciella marina]